MRTVCILVSFILAVSFVPASARTASGLDGVYAQATTDKPTPKPKKKRKPAAKVEYMRAVPAK